MRGNNNREATKKRNSREIMKDYVVESYWHVIDSLSDGTINLTKDQAKSISADASNPFPQALVDDETIPAPIHSLFVAIREGFDYFDGKLGKWTLKRCTDYTVALTKLWDKVESSRELFAVTKAPGNYVMPISAVVNVLAMGAMACGETKQTEIAVGAKGRAPSVYVTLNFEENNVSLPSNFTPFDREVFNAVLSLYLAGNTIFWPSQIYRVFASNTTPSQEMIDAITASVNKQMRSMMTIDVTEQAAKMKYKELKKNVEYTGNILVLESVTVTLENGKTVTGWRYAGDKEPLLYRYSRDVRQIISVDRKLLDTGVRNSDEVVLMKTYIIREIEKMKNGTRNNPKILYETIFDTCGIELLKPSNDDGERTDKTAQNAARQRKQRYSSYIERFFQYWKSTDYIKGYMLHTGRGVKDGIEVEV